MLRAFTLSSLALALSACATTTPGGAALDVSPSARARDDIKRERSQDAVRRMQDEFDQLTGGAG